MPARRRTRVPELAAARLGGVTRLQIFGSVAELTLDRLERRNALDIMTLDGISTTLERLADDNSVSVVIVTGDGGCFCAGLDRDELRSRDTSTLQRIYEASRRFHRAVVGFPKPLIAAADGYALGTGFDLAVMCDIRIVTDRAIFAHPEVRLGGVPLFTPLKLIVGDGWARRLCLDATPIDAVTAERIGLVTDVVATDELRRRAREIATSVAQAPLTVLRETKALFGTNPDPQTWLVTDHDAVFEAGRTIGRPAEET